MANGALTFLGRLFGGKLQPSCCAMEIETGPEADRAPAPPEDQTRAAASDTPAEPAAAPGSSRA